MKRLPGYTQILGAATFWGVAATGAKALLNREVDPFFLSQVRVTFSLVLLAAGMAVFRPALLRIRIKDLWRFALLGVVGVAGANVTYYITMKESSVATAILLQYAAPLLVTAYGLLSREERITRVKVVAAVLSVAGCYLAVGSFDAASAPITGLALGSGIASAMCFGFLTVFTRHTARGYDMMTVTLYAIGFASLFWAGARAAASWPLPEVPITMWLAFLGLSVISILIPYLLFFHGLRHLEPSQAVISSTLEPVVAIGSAFLVLGEPLEPPQLLGAVVVIAAITILQVSPANSRGAILPGR